MAEQSSRRTCGWGSWILAQHPSAGLDFVPQRQKNAGAESGEPLIRAGQGQISRWEIVEMLTSKSVCRRTQGVKKGRGGRWGGEKNSSKFSWGYWRFCSSQISARKKNRPSARAAGPSVAGSFINIPRSTPLRRPLSEHFLTKARGANRWAAWQRGLGGVWSWLSATR